MNDLLRLIIFEDEEIRTEPYSVLIAIVFLIFGIIITSYLTFKFRRDLQDLKEIQFVILPVYHITWLMLLRYIVSLIDFCIWYLDDGQTSLNGYYESMLWLAILYQFYVIVSDQDLIQISRSRIERYNLILKVLKIFLIIGLIIIFIVNFLIMNIILETIYLFLLFVVTVQIYKIIKTEMENVQSKINKIRLQYLLELWKYFLIYFLAILFGYGMMGSIYPEGDIDGIYFTILAFFMNLSPIMMALSVYWSVFIPERTRKKHDLGNPKTFI